MTAPRFPFWRTLDVAFWFVLSAFKALSIWALLYLGKPVPLSDLAFQVFNVAFLAWAVIEFDRYTFKREHLLAEQKLTRAYRALHACAVVIHDRVDRGVLVYGTPLHTTALVRKRKALEAARVAERCRAGQA